MENENIINSSNLRSLVSDGDIKKDLEEINLYSNDPEEYMRMGVGFLDESKEIESEEEKQMQDMIDKASEDESKIDLDVDANNMIISKIDLLKALKFATVMIKKRSQDIESSSLNITLDGDKVLYRLKDNMSYVTLTGTARVSNDKPMTKTLSLDVSYITKLLRVASNDIVLYEDTVKDPTGTDRDVVKIRLTNGDYILDVKIGDANKLNAPGERTEELCGIDSNKLKTVCDVMLPLINETQEVSAKRVIMYDDRAFFRSATYMVELKGEFAYMCLGQKELNLLRLLTVEHKDVIKFYKTNSSGENRIEIVTPYITISTSVSIPARNEVQVSQFSEIENAKYFSTNKLDFSRILYLSGLGTTTVSRVYMNYREDGTGIDARIQGTFGESAFIIPGNNFNDLKPLEKDINIYAVQLLVLLKSFNMSSDFNVAFLKSGVAFHDSVNDIRAIMNYVG